MVRLQEEETSGDPGGHEQDLQHLATQLRTVIDQDSEGGNAPGKSAPDPQISSNRTMRLLLPKSEDATSADHVPAQSDAALVNPYDNKWQSGANTFPKPGNGRYANARAQMSLTSQIYLQTDQRANYHTNGSLPQVSVPSTTTATSTNRWQQAREYRRKVHEAPQVDPHTDTTIPFVEQTAEFWVQKIYYAITNTHNIKDPNGSHAKKMFLPLSYDPLLVEATARAIYTSLLDRCKSGFRGLAHFNKALKPCKELEADRTATCEERMKNVVEALMWNKRVCKDVLYEDWKIRLLVNHPLAYDREKDAQKGSNDQRRARLQREREKLKRIEEELSRYRGTSHGTVTARSERWKPKWSVDEEEEVIDIERSIGTKRQYAEEDSGPDAKRPRTEF